MQTKPDASSHSPLVALVATLSALQPNLAYVSPLPQVRKGTDRSNMTFANLSLRFGERMLKDMGVAFDQVLQVDFNVDGDRGYSELTPGFSEYPVHVNYTRDGKHHLAKNTYEGLWEIVEILEDIDDDIRDSRYGR